MESIKLTKEKFIKIKDILIFILLMLWILLPVAQSFKIRKIISYRIFDLDKWYFTLMRIIGVIGILLGIFSLYDKFKNAKNKKNVLKEVAPIFLFVLYMIWTLVSCLNSPNKKLAFEGTWYRKEGYLMYINYAGFFLCAFLLESKKLRKTLLNIFIGVSIFLMIAARIVSGTDWGYKIFYNTTVDCSVFAQFNHYGYYLMISLMCCFGLFIEEHNKILKAIYAILYTVITYTLIYNNTFGCYLATSLILIAYAIYAIVKRNNIKATSIGVLIFIILSVITTKDGENLAFNNISEFASDVKTVILKIMNIEIEGEDIDKKFEKTGTYRMALWKNGIEFLKERPIIGFGPDNLGDKYKALGINQDRPHNLLIQLATTSGIPGMILYVTAVGIIVILGIKKLIKNKETGRIFLIVVITYLISAMFGNSMYYTSPYFFIFLGCLMNCNLNNKKEEL